MKTITINNITKREIEDIKEIRGIGHLSDNEFLHLLKEAIEQRKG